MKQLIQNFKTGDLYVDNLPSPALIEASVLVQNSFSLISAGTEKSTVKVAQSSLIGKARQRPDLVAQVLQNVRKEGFKATLEKVRTKLDSLKALGYSTSGTVLASADSNGYFKVGDRVACAGQDFASHADIVCVPQNLVVKIPDNVSFEEASFTTLGAIALQGIRQANPSLGESVCVIGLGLLGQITCQLLVANGCRVFGIDVSTSMVKLARDISRVAACERQDSNLVSIIDTFTRGFGFDKVIITAAAPTNDPVELAAEIAKKKGTIVIVGAVGMDIPRDPHFYRKELELKMSCSYGPGRYDDKYELLGQDYPHAYVRWTEQRNMQAFLDTVSLGRLNLKPLITHIFDIDNAIDAYNLVMGKKTEPYVGILLKYPNHSNKNEFKIPVNIIEKIKSEISVSFIGAGSFAQSYLIPNLKTLPVNLISVVTNNGINAKNVAQKYSFRNASTNANEVIANNDCNVIFIASRHDSHANYILTAIENKKHVFVEKPLCIDESEYSKLREVLLGNKKRTILMVGFNRRFAPITVQIKNFFLSVREPKVIQIRINAGMIPRDHWIQNPAAGGGRIIGEMCHFVDLMQFFTDADPVKVFSTSVKSENAKEVNDDNVIIVIQFSDGSVGNLIYVANGDKSLPKEQIEIFCGGMAGVINDFRVGFIHYKNSIKKIKFDGKGHKEEVEIFINSIARTQGDPISMKSILLTTQTTFKIIDSIRTGLPQTIEI